jgi:hypothetical protein
MEIQLFRLLVTEQELNDLMAKLIPPMEKVRNLRLKLLPEGISISGTYQTLIGVSFETLWEVFIQEGKIAARLQRLKTGGLGMGLLKGYLLQVIAAASPMIEIQSDTLLLDLDRLLEQKGLPLRTNLTALRCSEGHLTIESVRAAV